MATLDAYVDAWKDLLVAFSDASVASTTFQDLQTSADADAKLQATEFENAYVAANQEKPHD